MAPRKDRSRPSLDVVDNDSTPIEEEVVSPRHPDVDYLGMPDGAACRTIMVPGPAPKWKNYRYEGVGVIVPELPHPGVPAWVWEFGEVIVLWRRRVYMEGTPLYFESLYHPTRGTTMHIPFIERDPRPKVLALVAKGLGLLLDVESRGRPGKVLAGTPEGAKKEQDKVKRVIKKQLVAERAYNRRDIEFLAYGEEQGGKFLAQKIAPAKFNELEQSVLRNNSDLIKVRRKNVLPSR